MVTLDAMGESVITVDAEGRIDYINHCRGIAARPEVRSGLGQDLLGGRDHWWTKTIADSLGDPVRKALNTGGRVTMGRRAVLVPANGGAERSVEISVTPLRLDGKEFPGWCWCSTTPANCAA